MWIDPPESPPESHGRRARRPVGGPRGSGCGQSGQAAVSFVAVLPLLLAAAALLAQIAVVGYAAWSAAGAARAGARAELVGEPVAAAARAALPDSLSGRSRVSVDGLGGEVEVEIDAPRLLPLIPRLGVDASAAMPVERSSGG